MNDQMLEDKVIADLLADTPEDQQGQHGEQSQVAEQRKGPTEVENFARMRERIDRLERERDEALRARNLAEAQKNVPAVDYGIGDNDLVEGKHLSRVGKELNEMRKEVEGYKNQLLESRIRSNFPDYESVVNPESIDRLSREHPELSQTLGATSDKYAQAASAYKLIKTLGMYSDNSYNQDKQRVQENLNKPRPLTSMSPQTGDGPLSKANIFANGLTPELQKQMLQEMKHAIKNR